MRQDAGNPLHGLLLAWYDAEKRDLPWRRTRDPYAVWVSEIMLQQTQVATVLPYYERWMRRFPTVEALAAADDQEVLSSWQGLGYYRRARLLLQGARFVAANGMPETEPEWRKVPGVGRYTAGAIASIALGLPVPLVDGNVERVFARVAGCNAVGPELHKAAWEWALKNVYPSRPGDWNQALMELGATICRPANPECPRCPLQSVCVANREGIQNELPRRPPAPVTSSHQEIVWIPYYQGCYGVLQVPDGQWWEGMWGFPRAEASGGEASLAARLGPGSVEHVGTVRYQVTTHKVAAQVFLYRPPELSAAVKWANQEELAAIPIPAPDRRALKLAQSRLSAPSLFSE